MKILYIFPHPDDESFGPAAAIHGQLQAGHDVYLLTLTKGGATNQRHRLGLTIEQMGDVRFKEMLCVQQTLQLTWMKVLDLPDGGLQELDPRQLESVISKHIQEIEPHIVVTYPVHGISGFHDHLVTHAIVKRVFLELKDGGANYLKRLAFFTIPDNGEPVFQNGYVRLKNSTEALIDCVVPLEAEAIDMMKRCLDCYETYQETIQKSDVVNKIGDKIYFEIFNENFKPVLSELTDKLN